VITGSGIATVCAAAGLCLLLRPSNCALRMPPNHWNGDVWRRFAILPRACFFDGRYRRKLGGHQVIFESPAASSSRPQYFEEIVEWPDLRRSRRRAPALGIQPAMEPNTDNLPVDSRQQMDNARQGHSTGPCIPRPSPCEQPLGWSGCAGAWVMPAL